MNALRRQVIIVLALALATAGLLVTGLGWRWLGWINGAALAWRTPPVEVRQTDQEERLIRLNIENIILRRRLNEYAEIAGAGRIVEPAEILARGTVTARTLRQGRRFSELDIGAIDGVSLDDPAVLGWTLVGRVAGINQGRCLVQTVADAESRIPAALFDEKEVLAEGVLRGTGDPTLARLDHVEERADLQVLPGQRVVTTALEGLPAGLVLGTVESATRGETADHWRIEVRLHRDPDRADSLVILRTR